MNTRIVLICLVTLISFSSCTDPAIEIAKNNKEIVSKAFVVVGNGEYDKMNEFIAENYVRNCQATPDINVKSLDDFKEFIRQDRMTFPDQKIKVLKLVAEGDMVAFWAVYKATQTGQMGPFPPTNKYAELEFSGIHRIENDKIAETWITWDNIAFLSQLGLFPPPPPELAEE